ncbi:hypothetical protein F3Y22_tig00111388pilonHSYRG00205 [Hibiscus syriacus]|uniref:Homoserine dehydrogenase catalytic domain-containing protein n=1 Tax=Hibiscus syriacus TaxID=106335 RepID=A0A6A2YMD5_HIBSY|nr:hypothetical protein F3Y22_tig00111388pilonHSYRG00205 [Hibiscus syriacus]
MEVLDANSSNTSFPGLQIIYSNLVLVSILFPSWGVHLRVVGVSDGKSLVIASDVNQKELDDNILAEVCRVKSDGFSLSKLNSLAESRTKVLDIASILGKSTEDYDKLVSHPRHIWLESNMQLDVSALQSQAFPTNLVFIFVRYMGLCNDEVEDGKPLSQVVKSAKILGYTEPDPRDDLSGMDVCKEGSNEYVSMFLISTLFFLRYE